MDYFIHALILGTFDGKPKWSDFGYLKVINTKTKKKRKTLEFRSELASNTRVTPFALQNHLPLAGKLSCRMTTK